MALNGKIEVLVVNGRLNLVTSLDPVLVSLCLMKVAIKLLEEQATKSGSVISIGGLLS
jgi:hypothetical protein